MTSNRPWREGVATRRDARGSWSWIAGYAGLNVGAGIAGTNEQSLAWLLGGVLLPLLGLLMLIPGSDGPGSRACLSTLLGFLPGLVLTEQGLRRRDQHG